MDELLTWQGDFLNAVTMTPPNQPSIELGSRTAMPSRVQVYRDNHFFGLLDILMDIYQITSEMLGEPAFKAHARDFIRTHPLTCGDRNRYGAGFQDFLRQQPGLDGLDFVIDLASLEWSMHQAHHASDLPPLGFEALLDANAIAVHPSASRLSACNNVFELFQAFHQGTLEDFELAPGEVRLLVWRDTQDEVVCRRLTRIEDDFLAALAPSGRLEPIFASVAAVDIPNLQTFLAQTVPAGLYTRREEE